MAKDKPIEIDTSAGSRSFNRFDLQLSQSLHMAIELYDQFNYLLILDHYDDITVFDIDSEPLAVSYYQVKTSDNTITIDSAIGGNWIAKLYKQIDRPEDWIVKELGLITNTPLEVTFKAKTLQGKVQSVTKKYSAPRTPFTSLYHSVQNRIKNDIAEKCHIPVDEVDLSKFAHLHTTLSIDRHKDIVEKEMGDFLYNKYPRIQMDTIKAIYGSVVALLIKQQSNERMSPDSLLDDVKKYKGFSKDDFNRVIDKAIMISLPSFEDVIRFSSVNGNTQELRLKISLPYVTILTDSNKPGNEAFSNLFKTVVETMKASAYDGGMTAWEYAQSIEKKTRETQPVLCIPYEENYIAVLTICLLINMSRKNR